MNSGPLNVRAKLVRVMDGENEKPTRVESPATRDYAQDSLNHVLDFLSHASNETLGACLLGLGAITYFVLGRVGLLLIGTVVGIALHATWDASVGPGSGIEAGAVEAKRRRELGLDVIHRVLNWRDIRQDSDVRTTHSTDIQDVDVMLAAHQKLNFADFQPATGAALTTLVDAVVQDYVKYGETRQLAIVSC